MVNVDWSNLHWEDKKLFEEIGIEIIDPNRNYWFIRTQGGDYYEDFRNEEFVGIEWDEVSDLELINKKKEDRLKLLIIKYYPETERPGHPVNQILRFAHEIRKGDIVLIPSKDSQWISIGEFTEDNMYIYEEEDFEKIIESMDEDSKKESMLKKRRKVKWIKDVKKKEFDAYFHKIIYSHGPVVDANPYEMFIDRVLSPLHIKGDKAYVTYRVKKRSEIAGIDISGFVYKSIEILDEFGCGESKRDIQSKINVQSHGDIQLIGDVAKIFMITFATISIIGGEFSLLGYKYKTPGLSKMLLEWIETINKIKRDNKQLTDVINTTSTNLNLRAPELINDEIATEENEATNDNDDTENEEEN